MNGVIGTSLIVGGLLITLYTLMPSGAWIGIFAICVGSLLVLERYRGVVLHKGLRQYLPVWVNEYLTRTDIVDEIVVKLRENGLVGKLTRLVMIKWMDLSRSEVVEVLSGVWPRFRDLSEDRSLIQFAPVWFQQMYAPRKSLETLDEICEEPSRPVSPVGSVAAVALNAPNRSTSLVPLLLWLAENRVRWAVSEGLPVVRRGLVRTVVPMVAIFFIYRTLPRSRRPISSALLVLLGLYLWSITKGLPESTERLFKLLRISLYRKSGEKRFKTSQNNGSIEAVLFALIEPFVPMINVSAQNLRRRLSLKSPHDFLPPSSPAMSQASTLDATVIDPSAAT